MGQHESFGFKTFNDFFTWAKKNHRDIDFERDNNELFRHESYLLNHAYRFYIILQDIRSSNSVLDLGCYPGTLIRLCQEIYPNIKLAGVGIDLSPDFKDFILSFSQVEFYDIDLDTGSYVNNAKYDCVVLGEVLEHLLLARRTAGKTILVGFRCVTRSLLPLRFPLIQCRGNLPTPSLLRANHLFNPINGLRFAFDCLVPGGRLILTTPNITGLGGVVRLIIGQSNLDSLDQSFVKVHSDWRGHVRLYSKRELETMLSEAGFLEIRVEYYDCFEYKFWDSLFRPIYPFEIA